MHNNTTNTIEINGKKYKIILEEITEEPEQEKRKTGYERAKKRWSLLDQ